MPHKSRVLFILLCLLVALSCRGTGSKPGGQLLTAEVPLHLEDHLDAARIKGSEIPTDLPEAFEWRFEKDMQGWKATVPLGPGILRQLQASHHEDALRLTLAKENISPWGSRAGRAHVDIDDWNGDDWGFIVIQARTKDDVSGIYPVFNLREKRGTTPEEQTTFLYYGDNAAVVSDGEVHSYMMRMDIAWPEGADHTLKQLGISVASSTREKKNSRKGPISIDILSVAAIPREAAYAKDKAGAGQESRGEASRRVLYMHVPGKLEYNVIIPKKGRLDFGLGLLKKSIPVMFRISVRERAARLGPRVLFEETLLDEKPRVQRSVDLSSLAGKAVTLTLETEADKTRNVAFWTAPTISGTRASDKPNIIFYIIDGAAADFMSVYGYNRRTTPNLERLADEGAVFENAYSNSSRTKISVPSFMTSLHSSVLGGSLSESDPLPEQAVTMAERMHKAGYITEVLTSNPYAGRISGLDRAVDSLPDTNMENYFEREDKSIPYSADLHREFWKFREAYPGEPYWVHIQPTDVHWPWKPLAPFSGLFATVEERRTFGEMTKKSESITLNALGEAGYDGIDSRDWLEVYGIDLSLYSQISRKLYDESMAYQDSTIGKLVRRLKDRGEWENTLFIVAADHSHEHASLPLLEPRPPKYKAPLLAAQVSRIPMIFVWPGKIASGRRFSEPVSMIDMLPTVLDLAGLPAPDMAQGQSLAPLLLGKPGYKPRPVVFDEFTIKDKYFFGSIEVVDGRWGASLWIDPRPEEMKNARDRARPSALMIFDVWEDPHAFKSLHEERPDLVEKYSEMLDGIWKEHQALAKKFSRAGNVSMSPEQIETLRSLGYLH